MGVDFRVNATSTEGRISIVEHPIAPGRLIPPHRHNEEDELSYVLEGEIGVRIGDEEIASVPAGSYVWKPRKVAHTLWNPTQKHGRLIEIIVPGGYEKFFQALAEFSNTPGGDHLEERRALGRKFNVEYVPEWVPELTAKYNVRILGHDSDAH
jgi:quercetin dioxygenase-like cupin family protein